MARAHSIHVLQRKRDGALMAAWTVKHEMVTWLASRDESRKALEMSYQIVRLRDNHGGSTVDIPWSDIPEEEWNGATCRMDQTWMDKAKESTDG